MSPVFDVDRGGVWRKPADVSSVSRQHAKIGIDFVEFLAEHEASGGSIRWNASSYCLRLRYTDEQRKFFVNLLDTYIHKVLRKLQKLE